MDNPQEPRPQVIDRRTYLDFNDFQLARAEEQIDTMNRFAALLWTCTEQELIVMCSILGIEPVWKDGCGPDRFPGPQENTARE